MKRINVVASLLTSVLGVCLLSVSVAAAFSETPTAKSASLAVFAVAMAWTGFRAVGHDFKQVRKTQRVVVQEVSDE